MRHLWPALTLLNLFLVGVVLFKPASHPSQPSHLTEVAMSKKISDRKIIRALTAPEPIGPYSQAVQVGNLVFLSGQIGVDSVTGTTPATVEDETHLVMRNLGEVLKSAGCSYDNVAKATIFLKNMSDFGTVNKVYGSYFTEGNYPARETVEVSTLPKNVNVEISFIAAKPQ